MLILCPKSAVVEALFLFSQNMYIINPGWRGLFYEKNRIIFTTTSCSEQFDILYAFLYKNNFFSRNRFFPVSISFGLSEKEVSTKTRLLRWKFSTAG